MVRAFIQACGEAALSGEPAPTVSSDQSVQIRAGVERFLRAFEAAPQLDWEPSPLPLVDDLGPGATPLGRRFRELAPTLPWTVARQDPDGTGRGLVSLNDLFDLGPITAGLLCSQRGAGYPEHHHPPQELYVVLDGTASWRFGGAEGYCDVEPGRTFYNHPDGLHGIRNPSEPVVAMYILWGEGSAAAGDGP